MTRKQTKEKIEGLELTIIGLKKELDSLRCWVRRIDEPNKYKEGDVVGNIVVLYSIGHKRYTVVNSGGEESDLSEYNIDCIKKLIDTKT